MAALSIHDSDIGTVDYEPATPPVPGWVCVREPRLTNSKPCATTPVMSDVVSDRCGGSTRSLRRLPRLAPTVVRSSSTLELRLGQVRYSDMSVVRWTAAATFGLLVAACASTPVTRPQSHSPALQTPQPTVPNAISSPHANVPPLTVTAAPTCSGTQLQITYDPAGSGGAAGSFGIGLDVWNHGQPCQLRGWPSLQLLRTDGSVLPTHEEQATSTFAGSANPTAVILYRSCGGTMGCPPGIPPAAYISLTGDDVIPPCETAAGIRVLLPGGASPVDADLRMSGSFPTGQQFCSAGKIFVLPVHS